MKSIILACPAATPVIIQARINGMLMMGWLHTRYLGFTDQQEKANLQWSLRPVPSFSTGGKYLIPIMPK
jgi:hypothetical protein